MAVTLLGRGRFDLDFLGRIPVRFGYAFRLRMGYFEGNAGDYRLWSDFCNIAARKYFVEIVWFFFFIQKVVTRSN